tara:strand:- start:3514 stop:4371 length:858 start_codon:yes stop_codon:yes gene_type:complete
MKKKILKVSIIGKTNAGKSTLLNVFVGETISIINKKINTTLDSIIGVKNIDYIQLIFIDTPGINFLKNNSISQKKIKSSLWQGIDQSNIILYVIDSKSFDLNYLLNHLNILMTIRKKIIIVFNKIDLINKKTLLPFVNKINSHTKIDSFFFVSAKKNIGINKLLNSLKNLSINSEWMYKHNEITNKDEIFISNECTRNAILKYLHKELPYNIKVKNIDFKYLKNGDIKIKQQLLIEDLRYKKIILGKKGEKIKSIRESSQIQIKKILEKKIHLYLEIMKFNAKKS